MQKISASCRLGLDSSNTNTKPAVPCTATAFNKYILLSITLLFILSHQVVKSSFNRLNSWVQVGGGVERMVEKPFFVISEKF